MRVIVTNRTKVKEDSAVSVREKERYKEAVAPKNSERKKFTLNYKAFANHVKYK